jgi:hypothetical protein
MTKPHTERSPEEFASMRMSGEKTAIQPKERSLDEMFSVERDRDFEDIKELLSRLEKGSVNYAQFVDKWSFHHAKKTNRLKYTDDQIANGEWESEDFEKAIIELRKEREMNFFDEIYQQYEPASPIQNSIVRLEQERDIAQSLAAHRPVLIRGNWRQGKTSMVLSLKNHYYMGQESLFVDASAISYDFEDVSFEQFKYEFCLYEIASVMAKKELPTSEYDKRLEQEEVLADTIKASGKTPFAYLNDYLKERGETIYLAIDELISFAKRKEQLAYIASIQQFDHIQLAFVLHRIHEYEELFDRVFDGYETYFVQPLTVEETRKLVMAPCERKGITFTNEAIEKIHEITGGRPIEIQVLCRAIFNPYKDNDRDLAIHKLDYTDEDVQQIVEAPFWKLEDVFKNIIRNYKKIFKLSLSDEERNIILQLVENKIPLNEVNADIVQPLIDTTFVKIDKESGAYQINGDFFRKVISEYFSKHQ